MAGIRQWDTDWMDQFKQIFTTSMTNLQIYPGDPLAWLNVVDIPYGQKQVQRGIRIPDQNVRIAKDVEYIDKYARRDLQVADMPAISDSLRIDEEYYAGDTVNAIGHVTDIGTNFVDAIKNFAITGSLIDPLAYGLLDAGAGSGSTTLTRPDMCDSVSTYGLWTTAANMMIDIGRMEVELIDKGFYGPKILVTHPLVKSWLNLVLTNTATPYKTWVSSIGAYPIYFHPLWDPDATSEAVDVFMIDSNVHDLFMTPIKARGFFDNNTEDFVWHWQSRLYLLSRPLKDDEDDWNKGIVKCTVDMKS